MPDTVWTNDIDAAKAFTSGPRARAVVKSVATAWWEGPTKRAIDRTLKKLSADVRALLDQPADRAGPQRLVHRGSPAH